MVPLLVVFSRFSLRQTAIPFLVILGMYTLLNQSIGVLMFLMTLFLLLPAYVMGNMNREHKHAGIVIFLGFITILAQLLFILIVTFTVYDFNIIHWLLDQVRQAVDTVKPIFQLAIPSVNVDQQMELFVDLVDVLFTSMILLVSIYLSWVSYMVSRWILQKQGMELPPFLPFRDWKLPRSLIWYNILVIILGFMVEDKAGFGYALYMNMFLLLLLAFWLQGIGFLYFYCYQKNIHRIFPWIAIGFSVFSPVLYVFSFIGLLDMLFPIRKRFSN